LVVRLNRRADDRLQLSAQIEDTGIGMTPEEQSEVFQAFAQAQSGQRVQHGGTGLGLAISQGLARMMGGDITMSSQPGIGSMFLFEIPVGRGADQDLPSQSERRGRVLGIESRKDAPRILIADDVPDSREWLTKLLKGLGFLVRSAENGKTAVLAWEEWSPHLILMDMHMPVMDGLEAARRIRSRPAGKGTVIIALTADAMEGHRRVVLENDLNDFISKPCVEGELLEKIRTHLGLVYTYADETDGEGSGTALAGMQAQPGSEQPRELPADLIPRMREAIVHGDKALLDKLIQTIEERGDAQSATALRELADLYQYDRLTEWLEKACLP
jgi:CheY-like chemotaxis protein